MTISKPRNAAGMAMAVLVGAARFTAAAPAQAQTLAPAAQAAAPTQEAYAPRDDGQDGEGTYREGGYELSSRVAPASYEHLNGTLVATRTLAVRAAPDGESEQLDKLRRGDRFEALAHVRGSDWVLVGRDGVGVGYVERPFTRFADDDRYVDR